MAENVELTNEIDWFCYYCADGSLLTPEQLGQIAQGLVENGCELTMENFISVANDNGLCTDVDAMSACAARAMGDAASGNPPPWSVFAADGAEEGEEEEEMLVAPKQEVHVLSEEDEFEALRRDDELDPPPEIENVEPWMEGWPVLQDAAQMDPENARALLDAFLARAREEHCSDVHIAVGAVPYVRRFKLLQLLPGQPVLTRKAAENLNFAPLTEEQKAQLSKEMDLDYSYNRGENDRYRVNLMYQRRGCAGSFRLIDNKVCTFEELGFQNPEVIEKLTTYGQGLILITGPAGSGKSTTLTALVDHLNRNRQDHIITVEDPIEYIHTPQGCNVTQRELHNNTRSFGNALRAALREDPDVIIIGEMRDLETIEMAIHSSETGHLVIGTLHTSSATDTMSRLLDVFPPAQQEQIRAMVAESLRGIICQQLVPNADGTGCCMVAEILLGTLAVANLIRENKTYQLSSTLQTSKNLGMCTMEQSYFDLFVAGKRTYEQTLPFIKTEELQREFQRIGQERYFAEQRRKGKG